jgi:hypothetical protein
MRVLSAVPLLVTKHHTNAQERVVNALLHAVVYKTTKDYSKNVDIQLTDDKKSVASYPALTHVKRELMPVRLRNGCLLNQSGISANTVYLPPVETSSSGR